MAIDPLQTYPLALPNPAPGRKSGGASGFETLLGSIPGAGKGSGVVSRQSAAALLRTEMMLRSLALAADPETAAPLSSGALHSLLDSLALHGSPSLRRTEDCGAEGEVRQRQGEEGTSAKAAELEGIEATAAQYLGERYRFGGEGRDGFDCSSLVRQVFHEHQVELPRTAREQSLVGREVAEGELRAGDLVFFRTYAPYPSHVGIYLGGGKMIHASSEKGEVTVSDLKSDYYRSRYLGAKRVA